MLGYRADDDYLCYSNSDPTQVVFGGEVVGESAVQFEEQIGPQVKHTFEVIYYFTVCPAQLY